MLFVWESKMGSYLEYKVLTLKIPNFSLPHYTFEHPLQQNTWSTFKCFHKWTNSPFFTINFVKATINSHLHCCSLLRSLPFFFSFLFFSIFRKEKPNWSYRVNLLLQVFVRDLNANLLESFTSLSWFYFDLTFSEVPSGSLSSWPRLLQPPSSRLKALSKLFSTPEVLIPQIPTYLVQAAFPVFC